MWEYVRCILVFLFGFYQDTCNTSGEHIPDILLTLQFALPAWHQLSGTSRTEKSSQDVHNSSCKVAAATDEDTQLLSYTPQISSKHLKTLIRPNSSASW